MKLQIFSVILFVAVALAQEADVSEDLKTSADQARNVLDRLREALAKGAAGVRDQLTQRSVQALDKVSEQLNKVEQEAIRFRTVAAEKGQVADGHVTEKSERLRKMLDVLEAKYFELREHSKNIADGLMEKKRQVLAKMRETISNVRGQLSKGAERVRRQAEEDLFSKLKRLHDMYLWARRFQDSKALKPVHDFLKKIRERLGNGEDKSAGESSTTLEKATGLLDGLRNHWRKFKDNNSEERSKRSIQDIVAEIKKVADNVKREGVRSVKDSDVVNVIEAVKNTIKEELVKAVASSKA